MSAAKITSANTKSDANRSQSRNSGPSGLAVKELRPIDNKIPYKRSFFDLEANSRGQDSQEQGLIKSFRKNVKGLFESSKSKGIEKNTIIKLRAATGDLKEIVKESESDDEQSSGFNDGPDQPLSKKEMLAAKRQNLKNQSKEEKKRDTSVGIRLEIEKLKKKYPSDPNIPLLGAILTAKDSYSPHRSANDRLASLYVALQESGTIVTQQYLTVFSVDIVFDIYFLYLDVLNSKLRTDLKDAPQSQHESIRRDIRVLNVLLEQRRLRKSVSNVVKKFNGFGYPFISLSPAVIAKSYTIDGSSSDEKIGPGTVKLNKFLTQFYLSVFAQIPVFQPLAKRIADALPSKRNSRALITAVNLDNAITNYRIAKANNSDALKNKIMAVYAYGRKYIGNRFGEMTNPLDARILVKTAQMVDELAHLGGLLDEEMIVYCYNCASVAAPYLKNESTLLTRKIAELADRQDIKLH